MKLLSSNNRGSALIITMLLVMVVSAIGLGSARLTLSEVNQSRKLEDSTGAYYAAYSGIEQGLLLFRFHHDIQLSDTCKDMVSDPTHCVSPTATSGNPVNFIYDPNDAANPNGTGANYDLKIYYKSAGVGNFDNVANSDKILKKDEVIQLSTFGDLSNFIIRYQPTNIQCSNSGQCTNNQCESGCATRLNADPNAIQHGVEFKISNSRTGQNTTIFKDQRFDSVSSSRGFNFLLEVPSGFPLDADTMIQIIPYDMDIKYATCATDGTTCSATKLIDSGVTTIESTGYYGSTKRKLQVQVDRQTGTLLRTFDFVLYSGEGNINP